MRAALIVANDTYADSKLPDLKAPLKDAERLGRVLADPDIGGFEVELSRNEPEPVLKRRLGDFFRDRDVDDFLLVHFACHGVRDEDNALYLATPDTVWGKFDTTALPADTVIRLTEKSRSRRIVLLLDCCYSGAALPGVHARSDDSVELAQRFGSALGEASSHPVDLEEDGRGIAVLTASQAIERAYEGDKLSLDTPSSFFTSALVRGLETGEADLDENDRVSIADLYRYIDRYVRDQTPNQHPGLWMYRGRGDLNVARRPRLSLAVAAHRDYSALVHRFVLDDVEDELYCVAVSRDGTTLAAGTDGGVLVWRGDVTVWRWDPRALPKAQKVVETDSFVYGVVFSPDGSHLASVGEDAVVRVTAIGAGEGWERGGHHEAVYSVDYSPDGSLLVTGGYDGQAIVWDAAAGTPRRRDRGGGRISSVAFSPERTERVVAIGRLDNSVGTWNIAAPGPPVEIGRHQSSVEAVAFSPDGTLLASCGLDKAVRVWNVRERKELWADAREHDYLVRSVAFSPNGEVVVSGSWDKTIKLWHARSGLPSELPYREGWPSHTDWIWSVGFSADGLALISAGSDGKVIVRSFPEN